MKRILVIQLAVVVAALILVLVAVLGVRDARPIAVQDEVLLEMLGDRGGLVDADDDAGDEAPEGTGEVETPEGEPAEPEAAP